MRFLFQELHGLEDAQRNFEQLQSIEPSLVTALPQSAADGQVIDYVADATNGVVWRFRYRNASTSTHRWEFIGGAPLRSHVDTDETFTEGATYVDPATAGPSVTLPLAGDYSYHMDANLYVAVQTALGTQGVGLSIAGAQPAGPNVATTTTSGSSIATAAKGGEVLSQAASTALKLMYITATGLGGTAHTRYRELQVWPVRVG